MGAPPLRGGGPPSGLGRLASLPPATKGPAGRGQAAMRSCAPYGPAWRAETEIYSVKLQYSRHMELLGTDSDFFCLFLLSTVNRQLSTLF